MKVFYITPETNAMDVFNSITDHINTGGNQKRALIIEGVALCKLFF